MTGKVQRNGQDQAMGPLRVCAQNPRYFADGTGRPVYLTGAHTWNNLQHNAVYPAVDYPAYLDFLENHNHNYMRMWAWEQAAWDPWAPEPIKVGPVPYMRTGPGEALDGGPKFDVTQFNPDYFELLRTRVAAARTRGIYVSVMLFEGWSVEPKNQYGNPWQGHPFNAANNINGLDGDVDGDGKGIDIHTLRCPAEIAERQRAYVQKCLETLNDLDNVLWEIGNEMHPDTVEWQYRMIDFIHEREAGMPKQHPVGMTGAPIENDALFASPADWISPTGKSGYSTEPPAADGRKVIVADVDHIWPRQFQAWVWKSFTRGLNTAFMDLYGAPQIGVQPPEKLPKNWIEQTDTTRKNLGHTLAYARRMNLAAAAPHDELASTGYCLADPGNEYLVYQSGEGSFSVNLEGTSGPLQVEWFSPDTGQATPGEAVTGGQTVTFDPPMSGDAVLFLTRGP
ncbi:MAG: hypothetical protein JXR37_15640 [Kiritimatiellae bacterium]|nr:hypothetical protein [Kiritimatiellia bacterium]